MIKLTLPLPISVNQAYAGNGRIRYKSKAYKEWEARALESYVKNGVKYSIEGNNWLKVKYTFYTPLFYKNGNKKKIDLFNFEKCLSDWLEKNIEGFEDHLIVFGEVFKKDSERLEVEVEIEEATI